MTNSQFPLPRHSACSAGRIRFLVSRVLGLLILIWSGVAALAHNPGLSTLDLRETSTGLDAILTFARTDLELFASIDANHDGVVAPDEFVAALPRLEALAARALEVGVDGRLTPPAPPEVEMDENNNVVFKLHFQTAPGGKWMVRSLLLSAMPLAHRQYATAINRQGKVFRQALLNSRNDSIDIDASKEVSGPAKSYSLWDFVLLGIEHILTGYDHLLFLFALLIVCERFWDVAKIVTCFTVAHSLTLALAALEIVNMSDRIVEPAIAASIVYVGLENLFRKQPRKSRWLVALAFGLVHGFGFASTLREMGIAHTGSGVAGPLVSFNIGVEIGQIAVAAILLPVFWRLRRHAAFAPRWAPACSAVVVLLGGYWLVERLCF